MHRVLCLLLLTGLLLFSLGCALQSHTVPVWQEEPFFASFTAKIAQREELPLQGGMEISAQGGRMALMTQHGRTLGLCTWQANLEQTLRMHCEASEGLGNQVQGMVQRVALASYRIVYGLKHGMQEQSLGAYDVQGQDDSFIYIDNSGSIEIKLHEGGQ